MNETASLSSPVRTATLRDLQKEKERMTCISLFTGCGGAALGIRQAGFDIRVMVEWEKAACNTLRTNWVERPENWREILLAEEKRVARRLKRIKDDRRREVVAMQDTPPYWWQERPPAIMEVDITKTSTAEILVAAGLKVGEATLLEGGFPCQGFSMAGRRVIDDPRNGLYREVVRLLKEALPKTFMLENVKGLTSMSKGAVMKQICDDLSLAGYSVTWDVHDAADFGVPQHRERVIFLGERQDVMTIDAAGKVGIHMGAAVGNINYPDWFKKRYPALFQQALGI